MGPQEELLKASKRAQALLEQHLGGTDGRTRCCPPFLVTAKAILLASVFKAGCGLAVEHGCGVLMARLPGGSGKGLSVDSFSKQRGWSAPCFVRLSGLSGGVTLGAQRADLLIGVMSDAALERIAGSGSLSLGAEWSICLLQQGSDTGSTYQNHDLAISSLTTGCMFDFSVSAGHVCVDAARNRHTYGAGVDAAALLHGEVPLPQACEELAARMVEAEAQAAAACFEPSTRSESYW